jgi:hypothetical protein
LITDTFLFDESIKQIRLVLGDNNTIMLDGVVHDIDIPSGQSSGLKFKFDTPLFLGSTDSLTISFDGAASVNQTGNGDYKLHPIIHMWSS